MGEKMQDFSSMTPDAVGEEPETPADDLGTKRRVDFHRRATGHPTMATVAAVAGVSLKTVSRVINGEPGVQSHTIDRVRQAAQSLGYRRNDAAAALARAQPQATIGLIIEDLSDAFYSHLTRGVQEVAQINEYLVLLSSSEENSDLERSTTLALAARGVAGMIVVPHSDDHEYLSDVIDAGLSVVFADRPPVRLAADCVLSDNVEGARQAVEYLAKRGHRRIGFIGNDMNVYTSTCRLRGYEDAHAEAGLPVDESLVVLGPRTEADSAQAMHSLLRLTDPPTALFTQNSLLTLGAWRAIRDAVAQVALIGFDDFALAELLDPPVSVVAQDPVELGRQAAQLLFSRLAGEHGDARQVVVPTHLIIRH
jgi:LacI family transcriptional regulator